VTTPTPEMQDAVVEMGRIIDRAFPGRQCVVIVSPEYEGDMIDTMILTDVPTKEGVMALFRFTLMVWDKIVAERDAAERPH
jgi:hypothetical protein